MRPRLIVLTDTERFPAPEKLLSPLLQHALPRSVLVVVRDKGLPVKQRLQLCSMIREQTLRHHQFLVVAQRLDLALAVGADGVHLPANGISARDARLAYPQGWISKAVHEDEQPAEEELKALDAVLLSPAAAPRKGRLPLGVGRWATKARSLAEANPRLVAFALGGINAANTTAWLEAGAQGVAMVEEAHGARPQALLAALGILQAAGEEPPLHS